MSALLCGGTVECPVIKKRESKRGKTAKYIIKGPKYMLANIECMIKDYLGRRSY